MTVAFVLLFAVAAVVALATRKLRIPYTAALVIAGFGLGHVSKIHVPQLSHELLFDVFLPGLLFEAAFHLPWHELRRNALTIVSLAVPGVVACIALTAIGLRAFSVALHLDIAVGACVLFGAVVAATDPIAVVGVFRALGAPRRLTVLIEGESLINDGTAVVLFSIVLARVAGDASSLGGAVVDFVRVSGVGIVVGLVIGFVVSVVIKRIEDAQLEIALTGLAAYGSFIVADTFDGSGVLATCAAAMVCGSYGVPNGMTHATREAVESFWEFVAFALNSVVFLLVGVEGSSAGMFAHLREIFAAFVAMMLARLVVVALVALVVSRTRERIDWRSTLMLTWGGLRGALSMVLALSLPESYAGRTVVVTLTSGAVMTSIVVQGLTASRVLGALGIRGLVDGER